MPIFAKSIDELTTDRDKWIYIFKYLKNLKEQPAALKGQVFDKVFEHAKFLNLTKMEQNYYRECINSKNDYRNVIAYAKEEGKTEGREEGRREGVEAGQREKALEIARKLKDTGVELSVIVSATGLTEAEVENL